VDRREPTFRHEAYAEYKAQREKKPQDLYDQIDMIKDFLTAYGVPSYDAKGFEADDIIATIADKIKTDKVIILTGDKDTFQIVDEKINVLTFKKAFRKQCSSRRKKLKRIRLGTEADDRNESAGRRSVGQYQGRKGHRKIGAEKLLKNTGALTGFIKIWKILRPRKK